MAHAGMVERMKSVIPVCLLALVVATGCGTEEGGTATDPATAATSASGPETPAETPEETTSPTPKPVKPADGKTHELDGLTITTPKRWSDVGEEQTSDTVLSVMHTGIDDTPERLWVRRVADESATSKVARSSRQGLEEIGAVKVAEKGTVEIAGQQAVYSTANRSGGGVQERFHQYVLAGDDATWVLTFSINRWQQRPDPQTVIDSVLMTVELD